MNDAEKKQGMTQATLGDHQLSYGRASVGNDNASTQAWRDKTRLVTDKQVLAGITGTLVRHGRRRHLEDDVPEIQTRALEAARRGPMPRDVGEWRALAATIAERFAIDEKEKAAGRRKYEAGLCEDPDAYGPIPTERRWDPIDAKRYLAILQAMFDAGAMPEMGIDILWGVAEDVPRDELAEELGLKPRQIEYRLRRMRRQFAERLGALGMLVLLLVLPRVLAAAAHGPAANDVEAAMQRAG